MNNDIQVFKNLKDAKVDNSFLSSPINKKANTDFKYLCSQTGYSTLNNLNFLTLKTIVQGRKVGEFLVIGHDLSDRMVKFPKDLIDLDKEDHYVAVVCYKDDKVVDVLVFNVASFKKVGLLSIFKDLKKEDAYGVSISSPSDKKMIQYTFGYVLKNK